MAFSASFYPDPLIVTGSSLGGQVILAPGQYLGLYQNRAQFPKTYYQEVYHPALTDDEMLNALDISATAYYLATGDNSAGLTIPDFTGSGGPLRVLNDSHQVVSSGAQYSLDAIEYKHRCGWEGSMHGVYGEGFADAYGALTSYCDENSPNYIPGTNPGLGPLIFQELDYFFENGYITRESGAVIDFVPHDLLIQAP